MTHRPSIPVPEECRAAIRAGALVALSTSGGKDSQAMTVLLSRIVPGTSWSPSTPPWPAWNGLG